MHKIYHGSVDVDKSSYKVVIHLSVVESDGYLPPLR